MSLQLDLFADLAPPPMPVDKSPETDAFSPLAAQLLAALRIHNVADHARCTGDLAELERMANGILRGVESRRPLLTDERWQAALYALPYFYIRGLNNYGI